MQAIVSIKTLGLVSLLLFLFAASPASAREKTDIVWLKNGDRITGEVKQLVHGILRVNTDSMAEVRIEWEDVARVESDFEFQFERTDGTRITGMIATDSKEDAITVTNEDKSATFAPENVVRISQIEDTFWDRLKGSFTFGYSYTKASDIAQGNLGFRATHRTEIRSFSLDGSTIITGNEEDQNTQRSTLRFEATRFRKNRWFSSYLFGLESNDELGLNLRSSVGAGLGRYLIQSNTSELALLGGAVGTVEDLNPVDDSAGTFSGESSKKNLEGLLGIQYDRYIFDDPTVDISSRLTVFPSITESGRLRAQFDINLRWELISDLFWDLNFYNTYDSDPAAGSQSTNDYGVVTSLGWSF